VLCLFRSISGRSLSAMVAGSPGIQTAVYESIDEAKRILANFLNNQ